MTDTTNGTATASATISARHTLAITTAGYMAIDITIDIVSGRAGRIDIEITDIDLWW